MASATYRVIQHSEPIGTVTREQVRKAIRAVMVALGEQPVAVKKATVSAKPRRAPSKR